MSFPSLEKSLDKVSNRYLLVVLAAKRARQLNRGAPGRERRSTSKHKKPTSVGAWRDRRARQGASIRAEGDEGDEPAKELT